MPIDNIRIKKIKSIIKTNSFNKDDVFDVHRIEPNGNVYFFDKEKKECRLTPNEYMVIKVVKEEE